MPYRSLDLGTEKLKFQRRLREKIAEIPVKRRTDAYLKYVGIQLLYNEFFDSLVELRLQDELFQLKHGNDRQEAERAVRRLYGILLRRGPR